MHIGFDVSQTGAGKAGCGYYADAMIRALLDTAPHHRFSLYPSFGDFYFDAGMPAAHPYPGRGAGYGPRHRTLEEARDFWSAPGLEARLGHPDVVHANNYWCPTRLELARLVYTLYDLSFIANPAWTTPTNRDACFEGVSRASEHADWIVAISTATREHYLREFPRFPPERIRVIPPCARFAGGILDGVPPAPLAGVAPGRFWLSVGTLEPRKNQRRIAEAYARYLGSGAPAMPLVFAGGHGWMMEGFGDALAALGIASQVILTGYVSDEELAWLYRNCHAHVYFSHFEGFGLPVLEGMQFGAPTIASAATSIPEVAGDAAILVSPDDTAGLARAMARVAGDPAERARLSEKSRARAARFDWKASATALLEVYAEAVAAPSRRKSA